MTTSHGDFSIEAFPLLFRRQWRARGLDTAIASIDPDALHAEYVALRGRAPRRSSVGRPYFAGHDGIPSSTGRSNRLEEHCAIALVNLARSWPWAGGGWFRLLDYQVPLKARQSDTGIGKIDLLGVTDEGRLVIVELKVGRASGGRSDAPPAALMEGLRYAAIVEADQMAIAAEIEARFGIDVSDEPPIVQVLAPQAWWRDWLDLVPAGNWGPAFARLSESIGVRTGVTVECMALEDAEIAYGLDGQAPRFDRVPAIYPVSPGISPSIGSALILPSLSGKEMSAYEEYVRRDFWSWADRHHAEQLDGGDRVKRPPVLRPEFVDRNVLVPQDDFRAERIRSAIRPNQRHRYFASLRSSQALAQCVFGALEAFDRLDLLDAITAECGRPAFYTDGRGWTFEFEHEVRTLREPRPSNIDVWLTGPDRLVAIECKFTELEFGTCSRPRLRPTDKSYAEQHCDGSYRTQAGRSVRCALTGIGVQYWDHLPKLFAWSADRDHVPCPFGEGYQLARNALAAVVTSDGEVDPARGHALLVYDARNPAFGVGGKADRQWEDATAACLVPGLMRRLSWQRLLGFVSDAPELGWLIDGAGAKYGLIAE